MIALLLLLLAKKKISFDFVVFCGQSALALASTAAVCVFVCGSVVRGDDRLVLVLVLVMFSDASKCFNGLFRGVRMRKR